MGSRAILDRPVKGFGTVFEPYVGSNRSEVSNLLTGTRTIRKRDAMSPLRYPGSKRKLLPAIQQLVDANIPMPELFVEPFCGGSSVALGLLEVNAVKRVILADLDPLIASFWYEATQNTERLIEDMMLEPVTVERWDYWRTRKPRTSRNQALKCIFLNRTTFSGIIRGDAGPIGGRAQTSEYTIACRFDKQAIARRIRTVGRMFDDGRIISVHNTRWQDTIKYAESVATKYPRDATVLYIDPPYIEKASRLYNFPFANQDHHDLATYLTEETAHRWILSYDKEPLVVDLYQNKPNVVEFNVIHHYTMRGKRRNPVPAREVIFTNLPNDPNCNVSRNENERHP